MYDETYGLWTVVGEKVRKGDRYYIPCRCVCGTERDVAAYTLKRGTSSGCRRCRSVKAMNEANTKHGHCNKHPLYGVWKELRQRCSNPSHAQYSSYGGRGITVCQEWDSSYIAFYNWAIANKYNVGLYIDRRDNNGGYSPANCRWVTNKANCRNARHNRLITAWGETKCLAEWIDDERCIVPYSCAFFRIERKGIPPEEAFTIPSRST